MANIENKFEEPTKDNVEKGDFLVVISSHIPGLGLSATYSLIEITDTNEERIEGKGSDSIKSINYREAIVLKKNGKYLVGEFIQKYRLYLKPSN